MTATIDATTKAGARALERLETEIIGWLTTVNPDGQPQSSPIWFLWTDDELLIYSHKRAPRNDNLVDRPLVSFNLNTDAVGDDVVTMEGLARIDDDGPPATANDAYLAKYRGMLDEYDWTAEYFAAEYPLLVRITPTRWRVG
jgi:PPOX class probable F420-dependent enzyme